MRAASLTIARSGISQLQYGHFIQQQYPTAAQFAEKAFSSPKNRPECSKLLVSRKSSREILEACVPLIKLDSDVGEVEIFFQPPPEDGGEGVVKATQCKSRFSRHWRRRKAGRT
jgi:hypothetical protein